MHEYISYSQHIPKQRLIFFSAVSLVFSFSILPKWIWFVNSRTCQSPELPELGFIYFFKPWGLPIYISQAHKIPRKEFWFCGLKRIYIPTARAHFACVCGFLWGVYTHVRDRERKRLKANYLYISFQPFSDLKVP